MDNEANQIQQDNNQSSILNNDSNLLINRLYTLFRDFIPAFLLLWSYILNKINFVFILIFILFIFPILQNIKINKFHIKQHHLNFLLYLHTIFIHEI